MSVRHNPIEVGTMASSILYNRGKGYVLAVDHNGPCFDIVFVSGSYSRRLPESILRGVQWTIYPRDSGFANADQLAELSRYADEVIAEAARAEAAERAAFDCEAAALGCNPEYSSLVQGNTADGVIAARNIRTLLKASFPATKFSVRKTDHGVLRVAWTGGPEGDAVEAITQRFKSGFYDAHRDYHETTITPWMKVFGHAEYIFTSRD